MLTDKQLNELFHSSENLMNPVSDWLLADICRRIVEAGRFTNTAEYNVWRLKNLGVKGSTINNELQKRLKMSQSDVNKLIADSSKQGYEMDVKRLTTTAPAFKDNLYLQQLVTAETAVANGNFNNLTQTIGFVIPNGTAVPLTQAYNDCCNFAFQQTATGATDLATAVKRATANLVRYGVRTIDYASGIHTSVEAAVRRAVLGAIGLIQEKILQHNHDELGANGWELSAHEASAPDHEPYQGLQFTDSQYTALNNSLQRRIGTLNCKHIAFPIIYGKTKPVYTPVELAEMKQRNAEGITYNGKHYTKYEATQHQRAIERKIRDSKRALIAAQSSGNAAQEQTVKVKLTSLFAEYNRFSNAAGLRPQYSRYEIGQQVSAAFK